jgi:hypothetical protein
MADEMRKYRVSFTKMVRAIDKTMAASIAADHIKNQDCDCVRVVMVQESIADRLGTYRNELPTRKSARS